MSTPIRITRLLAAFLTLSIGFASIAFGGSAHAAVKKADANYATAAGKATEDFFSAIGKWSETYQAIPDKRSSPDFKNWVRSAEIADKAVAAALTNFSRIKIAPGFRRSDVTMRKFIKAYSDAIKLFAPAIKKNDKKLMQQANDTFMAATALFTTWSTEFAKDSKALTQ